MLRRRLLPFLATLVAGLTFVPSAHAALTLGVDDDVFLDPALGATWLSKVQAMGSRNVRLTVRWRYVAPEQPSAAFVATDPASPEYRWADLDLAVDRANAAGQRVLLQVVTAPAWAEGPGTRPKDTLPGVWKPDPDALGAFFTALATRYRGRAEGYQVWNEPNLGVYLAPQWTRKGAKSYEETGPELYRGLLNASYRAVKAVDPGALVVQAGTGPYGEPKPGGPRMQPLRFVRRLLSKATYVDVVAHHPYGVTSPYQKGYWPDDVTMAELGNLVKIWKRAEKAGTLLPRKPHPRWATEFGWESRPDPSWLTQADQARYLAEGVSVLEAAGFTRAYWYLARDERPVPSYPRSAQSGLFLRSGTAKAAASMFAFPLAARRDGSRTRVFALPRTTGACSLLRGRTVVKRLSCRAATPLRTAVARQRGARLRLVVGTVESPVAIER